MQSRKSSAHLIPYTANGDSRLVPVPTLANNLLSTAIDRRDELPLPDGLAFLRDALHRFVRGGIYLFAGAPGGGKSLLACQIGVELGRQGIGSLFIVTEQGPSSMKETATRITADWDRPTVERALAHIQISDGLYDVNLLPALVTRTILNPAGPYHGVKLVVLDSIQGHGLAAAATKAYGKVLEAARLCAENGITVILVSHVTKRGDVAGPKTLEHGVDAALFLRRAMQYSLLAVRKNRFGPPLLRMMPLTIDPVTTRLGLAPHAQAAPGAARTVAGPGSGFLQIQASVAVPADGAHGRLTAPGLPKKEIEQLVDCIGQIDTLDLSDLDYRIQCRLPGSGRYSTHFGLPLCMALIASYSRKTIPARNVYLGEVDLFRKILAAPSDLLLSFRDAIDHGDVATPLTLFVPPTALEHLPQTSSGVKIVPCGSLEDAVYQTWPDLR
jgi:DNA repair protein RadA/Sms